MGLYFRGHPHSPLHLEVPAESLSPPSGAGWCDRVTYSARQAEGDAGVSKTSVRASESTIRKGGRRE